MVTSAFFNSKNGDRMYKAEDFAEFFASFIGNGVFPNPSTGLQVRESGDGMKIIVQAGKAWINGYFFHNKSDYVFTLDGSDGVLKRIDRIVVRWSLPDRAMSLAVKKGSLSVTPVAPTLQRDGNIYELALADIAVNTAVVTITQASITDLRLNTSLCGIVSGTVSQADTTTIFNQYQSWFDSFTTAETAAFTEWFDSVKDILDENTAMQLKTMIDGKQNIVKASGLLKCDGNGNITPAIPGVDYMAVGSGGVKRLKSNLVLYLNANTGSDTNDGLSAATAFKTIQKALDEVDKYDFYDANIDVNLAAGTYTDNLFFTNKHFRNLTFTGNQSSPTTVVIPKLDINFCTGFLRFIGLRVNNAINIYYTNYVNVYSCNVNSGNGYGIVCGASHVKAESNTISGGVCCIYSLIWLFN